MSQARVRRPYEGLCPVSDLQFGQDALQPTGESANWPTSETFQTKPPASMGWVARHARAAAGRLRTAHKYSNATDRERPQGTATGQRPAPTTANDLPAESRIEGSPIWP